MLALIAAADPLDCVACVLPSLLAVDAASLCVETRGADAGPKGCVVAGLRHRADTRTLPPGAVAMLLGGRDVVLREQPADAGLLHAEAAMLATRDALVRVPLGQAQALRQVPGVLLALVSRNAEALQPGAGVGSLAFLGRALGLVLERRFAERAA